MEAVIKKLRRNGDAGESGEIMIEGMFIMIVTMFILFWLIGLGFLYYERYIITIINNDAAKKIAATYNQPSSDMIMGFTSTFNVTHRPVYRHLDPVNELGTYAVAKLKTENYVKYMLDITNFPGAVDSVDVDIHVKVDSVTRKHVIVTSSCTFWTPMAGVFDFFGMGRTQDFEVTSYAEVIDYSEYVAAVNFATGLGNIFSGSGKLLKGAEKLTNKIIQVLNDIW